MATEAQKALVEYGISAGQYQAPLAVRDVKEKFASRKAAIGFIEAITGCNRDYSTCDDAMVRFVSVYVAQQAIETGSIGDILYDDAYDHAQQLWNRIYTDKGDLSWLRSSESLPGNQLDVNGEVKPRHGSRKEQALDLYGKNHCEMTRKQLIAMFVAEIGMTAAGASTYVYMCQKDLGPCKKSTEKRGRQAINHTD